MGKLVGKDTLHTDSDVPLSL